VGGKAKTNACWYPFSPSGEIIIVVIIII